MCVCEREGADRFDRTLPAQQHAPQPHFFPPPFSSSDRIHRLGATKPVTVVRFIVAGTIEERVLALQAKKEAVFEGVVGADQSKLASLSADDMRFLFSG